MVVARSKQYWNTTPLAELSREEWESLCDGCGKCCLHKLEDNGEVYYTDLACRFIDLETCNCIDYPNRHTNVPNCIAFGADDIQYMDWLPDTCAYRLRHRGEPLYNWHYLISGSRESVHEAGESVKDFAIADNGQDVEEHILYFKP